MNPNSRFLLNGEQTSLDGADPRESMLRWLKRNQLTGTKEGCADGDCGACTVVLRERNALGKAEYRAVNSCLLPVGMLAGREVLTVEALAEGETLHPVQQALVEHAGSQCGYCTPGFVMSLFAGLHGGELGDAAFEGNLCRCTGYQPIRRAAAALADAPAIPDRFSAALANAAPALPAAQVGVLHSPATLAGALALKSAHPEAVFIAGATDLGVRLSHGDEVAPVLIALDRIDELQQLAISDDRVCIGAGVSLSRIERELAGVFPALDQMLHGFAARQVRNRATLGGNLGSASPIGDLLPVLLALDAIIVCQGGAGVREIAVADFFTGYRKTVLASDELIAEVRIPRVPGTLNASLKLARRATDDISIVAAVFAIRLDEASRVVHARLAFGGVAATPVRAVQAEVALGGRRLDADTVAEVGALLEQSFTPLDDHRASAAYRRALCRNLFERFVAENFA